MPGPRRSDRGRPRRGRSRRSRRDRRRNSAPRRRRCAPPRPACRRNSDSRCRFGARGALQRFVDGAAHHELAAQDAHRLRSPPGAITGSPQRATRRRSTPPRSLPACRRASTRRPVSISAQVEALTNSESDWPRWLLPIGGGDLVADQPVGGLGVGNAQQRLGEAHQRHALAARERVFLQEGIDAALPEPRSRAPYAPGRRARAAMRSSISAGSSASARMRSTDRGLVRAISRAQAPAVRIGGRRGFGEDHRRLGHGGVLRGANESDATLSPG